MVLAITLTYEIFFADDNYCQSLQNDMLCTEKLTLDGLDPLCTWDKLGDFCYLLQPEDTLLWVLEICLVAGMVSVPLNYIILMLCRSLDGIPILHGYHEKAITIVVVDSLFDTKKKSSRDGGKEDDEAFHLSWLAQWLQILPRKAVKPALVYSNMETILLIFSLQRVLGLGQLVLI
jgi:hypothetical protein